MDSIRVARRVPLFSKEANELLSKPTNLDSVPAASSEVIQRSISYSSETAETPGGVSYPDTSVLQCSSCKTSFSTREEQVLYVYLVTSHLIQVLVSCSKVEHYGLDWHRFNLKRRLKNLLPLSQNEFELITG